MIIVMKYFSACAEASKIYLAKPWSTLSPDPTITLWENNDSSLMSWGCDFVQWRPVYFYQTTPLKKKRASSMITIVWTIYWPCSDFDWFKLFFFHFHFASTEFCVKNIPALFIYFNVQSQGILQLAELSFVRFSTFMSSIFLATSSPCWFSAGLPDGFQIFRVTIVFDFCYTPDCHSLSRWNFRFWVFLESSFAFHEI